jgi:aldehyde dehydrogenase (NAD+)
MSDTKNEVDKSKIRQIFDSQLINQYNVSESSAKQRIHKLEKLSTNLMKYNKEIKQALYLDYKRPAAEVDLTEIFPVTSGIKHAVRHLNNWMANQKVATPLSMIGSSSWIQYEPKGVCLIISPWNYPIQLALGPLTSAIAAGNTAIIKPSEITPNSSSILRRIVEDVFDENEVAVIEGAVETATELLELPFNHIFFTGSLEVGKIVMASAAKNLASVTLELGGKSPVIIDETADINTAATRISMTKFSNNGQMCIVPDYVFIHESKLDEFEKAVKSRILEFYGEDVAQSASYMRIVNARNFNRIKSYIDDAIESGAKLVHGGKSDINENFIEPTVVTNVSLDSSLMKHEIFGPVLPIVTYSKLNEVISFIRSGGKPLALYIYSKSKQNIRQILRSTSAGGTCINNNALHYFNHNLPFGGSNNSGIGKSHGKFGFLAFSNERAVYKQILPSPMDFLKPPYNNKKMKFIKLILRWF